MRRVNGTRDADGLEQFDSFEAVDRDRFAEITPRPGPVVRLDGLDNDPEFIAGLRGAIADTVRDHQAERRAINAVEGDVLFNNVKTEIDNA